MKTDSKVAVVGRNVHRDLLRSIRDGGKGKGGKWGSGGGGVWQDQVLINSSSQALRPTKTEETSASARTIAAKEVGTSPVPSNLCTPRLALSREN